MSCERVKTHERVRTNLTLVRTSTVVASPEWPISSFVYVLSSGVWSTGGSASADDEEAIKN